MSIMENRTKAVVLNEEDLSRIIEMAWEDRTPFEAITLQFGINQDGVIRLMRRNLKRGSFHAWRQRTHGRLTKHIKLRDKSMLRHQSPQHNKLHR
jgi:uncharacterized protein (TIGR03643 family)